jgi:hypothetical protein
MVVVVAVVTAAAAAALVTEIFTFCLCFLETIEMCFLGGL